MPRSSFTLIELLVVIAILAILATAIVVVINPVDLIKQSRDSTRLTDLQHINKALALFDVTNPDDFTGTSTIIYTSLPDTSSTCSGMTPPSGYLYNCVTSSTLALTNGTGWIPVNFQNISYGSPIGKLPVDPTNSSTTGQFYTYIMGGSWELNALYESSKYKGDTTKSKEGQPGVLSVGSNINLNPVYSTNGLLAYYKFDEQTGTTLNDKTGNGYTGTITPGTGGWTTDNLGNAKAYEFDGADTKITLPDFIGTSSLSLSAWIYLDSFGEGNEGHILADGQLTYKVSSTNGNIIASNGGDAVSSANGSITTRQWTHVVLTRSGGTLSHYINEALSGTPGGSTLANGTAVIIGNRSGNDRTFDGKISDVRIYNRVLSAAEIKAIYNATR